jgi:methylated-DNA-protein-cysteine methyltransferase-like protein
MKTFQKIYKVVSSIPEGKVISYKQVAKLTKISNARIVGFALHVNDNPIKIPCHRVVKNNRKLSKGYAFGGEKGQRAKLIEEGIKFIENKIPTEFFLN